MTETRPARSASAAEADLAFLRGVVEGQGGRDQTAMGGLFLAGGLLYGVQCLFHLGQIAGVIRWSAFASLTFVTLITLVMLIAVGWAVWYGRKAERQGRAGSTVARAIEAAFSGTGCANAAIIIVFGVGSARDHDFAVWLYYPAVVFAFQFVAWFMAWRLRRKAWLGLMALGTWSTALALGLLVRQPVAYLWVCTAALFLVFALPGALILRQARVARAAAEA